MKAQRASGKVVSVKHPGPEEPRKGARGTARPLAALLLGGVALALAPGCPGQSSAKPILLSAAVSLRGALTELVRVYRDRVGGPEILATYGASGTLRQQVEGGAPVDAVLYASASPVDRLVQEGLADPSTQRVFATNRLVLIAPRGTTPAITFQTIDRLPPGSMLAIGSPGAVPAGDYARSALRKLEKWEALQGRLVLGGDVAAVLQYARRGEVAAAIVYRTDLQGVDDVVVLDEARGDWSPRAEYVCAVIRGGPQARRARGFLDFLGTPEGLAVLKRYGFGPP